MPETTGCGAVGLQAPPAMAAGTGVAWTAAVGTQDGALRAWCQARQGASWDRVTGVEPGGRWGRPGEGSADERRHQ